MESSEAYELGDIRPRPFQARVQKIDLLTEDVARLVLQIPASLGFRFVPGQYVDVLLEEGHRRSYSIANGPDTGHSIELHVRWMPGGRFTNRVFTTLRHRELLQLEGPHGSFFIRQGAGGQTILVASGTGFAPIRAMLLDLFSKRDPRPLHLFWGGRRPRDLYALGEVASWAATNPHFSFTPVCSEPSAEDPWSGRTGFVHLAALDEYPDMRDCSVYACGVLAMVEAARTDFSMRAGLPRDRFFADAFLSQRDRSMPLATSDLASVRA
jgi:CDP-4-dehydro-6-deoxyglucose reductase